MEHKEILEKILDQAEDTRDCISKLDKKIDLHIQKTELEFQQIRKLDEHQNKILEEHSNRSLQLERDNNLREESLRKDMETADDELGDRLEKLEKPREWLKTTFRIFFWIASAAGAIYGLYQFMDRFILK